MSRYVVEREFWFSAAHMVEGHPKCGRMHGHNYRVKVSVAARALDSHGMVLDFAALDDVVKPIINSLDHYVLYSEANIKAENPYIAVSLKVGDGIVLHIEQTTAECLAEMIHTDCVRVLACSPSDVAVEVQETPRNTAMYVG